MQWWPNTAGIFILMTAPWAAPAFKLHYPCDVPVRKARHDRYPRRHSGRGGRPGPARPAVGRIDRCRTHLRRLRRLILGPGIYARANAQAGRSEEHTSEL